MAVYAVDFDGTLAVTRFPEIIGPRKKVVAAVKMLKASGHKIILWTSRDGKELEAAVEWCKAQGIVFDDRVFDPMDVCIGANTLSGQKARVLLMLALTITKDVKQIRNIFNQY